MLFVFLILVILVTNRLETKCFTLRNLENELNKKNEKLSAEEFSNNEDAALTKYKELTTKHFYKIIQNLTNAQTSNLKSNVFDKMLSDEMLAIKRYFHEKDLSPASLLITNKISAPTPTIEVKQKWPIVKCAPRITQENKDNMNEILEQNTTNINNEYKQSKEILPNYHKIMNMGDVEDLNKQDSKDKILGLRSLPESVPAVIHGRSHHVTNSYKLCTCRNTNPSTCSHRYTGSSVKCCTQISHSSHQECTRTSIQYTIYPAVYVTYSPYFIDMSTNAPYKNSYYHPNIIDRLKLPKKQKLKKTTKQYYNEHLYYDYTDDKMKIYDNKYYDEYLENEAIGETGDKKEESVVLNVHYEYNDRINEDSTGRTIGWGAGYLKNVNQDKLVKDIINDLKYHYSDVVIKDCHCTSSSVNFVISFSCTLLSSISKLIL